MQFSRDGDWYQVARITGPTHNMLGLKLCEPQATRPIIEAISAVEEARVVDPDDVQRQVLEGVSQANAQLGTNFQVAAIRFITTDTPSSSIYGALAKVIVEHYLDELNRV